MKKSAYWAMAVSGLITLLCWSIAESRRQDMVGLPLVAPDYTTHLGCEYDFIAQAIYEGRGFSDPFGRSDGPTAWMPPVLPALLSCAYWVFNGDRPSVVSVAKLVQVLGVWIVLSLVLERFAEMRYRAIAVAVATVAAITHLWYLFQFTHDHTVLVVLVTFLWHRISASWTDQPSWLTTATSGVCGGVLALSSPVIGMVWAILTAARLQGHLRHLVVSAAISMLLVSPWIIRCRIVMGEWIPIKSNASYELWQSQVADDDGVIDSRTFLTHPSRADSADAKTYSAKGERVLLDEKRVASRDWLQTHRMRYASQVSHRAIAALWYPAPFTRRDATRLLAWTATIFWKTVCFNSLVAALLLRSSLHRDVHVAIAIWLVLLLPYIAVSYYERYEMPLFGLKLFVVLSVFERLVSRFNIKPTSQRNHQATGVRRSHQSCGEVFVIGLPSSSV